MEKYLIKRWQYKLAYNVYFEEIHIHVSTYENAGKFQCISNFYFFQNTYWPTKFTKTNLMSLKYTNLIQRSADLHSSRDSNIEKVTSSQSLNWYISKSNYRSQ